MQNNNKSKGFRSFVKEKGYYIVLLLCAAAVGVSGYFLLSNRNNAASPEETPVIATIAPSGTATVCSARPVSLSAPLAKADTVSSPFLSS